MTPTGTTRQNDQKRILLVDDEPSVTTVLRLLFERNKNYQVKVENDSESALAAAEEFKPDLVFMDLTMPTVDGGELASRFRDNPRLSSVPIVFLTGTVTKTEVAEHRGYIGGLQFIAKPSNRAEILACVRHHFDE
jgi:CheY-like chemotaxis protein